MTRKKHGKSKKTKMTEDVTRQKQHERRNNKKDVTKQKGHKKRKMKQKEPLFTFIL